MKPISAFVQQIRGFANIVAGRRQARSAADAKASLATVQKTVARLSALSLAVLWITGIALLYGIYGEWAGMAPVFWVKIAAVVALTIVSVTAQVLMARKAPAPFLIRPLGLSGLGLALLSVLLATIAFAY